MRVYSSSKNTIYRSTVNYHVQKRFTTDVACGHVGSCDRHGPLRLTDYFKIDSIKCWNFANLHFSESEQLHFVVPFPVQNENIFLNLRKSVRTNKPLPMKVLKFISCLHWLRILLPVIIIPWAAFLQNILFITNSNKSNSNEKSLSNLHARPFSKASSNRLHKTSGTTRN